MNISKLYPSPVNIDGLMESVRAIYSEVSSGEVGFRVHNIAPEDEQSVNAVLDAIIASHDHTALTADQIAALDDATNRQELIAQYFVALSQILNDKDDINTGKTALQNAVTLAQVKPVVDGMLTIMQRQLIREERTIKAIRAVIRNG